MIDQPRKYKLLKDLVDHLAGDILDLGPSSSILIDTEDLKTFVFSEYFGELPTTPERWRAAGSQSFYYMKFDSEGLSVETGSAVKQVGYWVDAQYKVGNYFPTEDSAQAVADAIKALLEYVHIPYDNENPQGYTSYGREKIFYEARKAIQAAREDV